MSLKSGLRYNEGYQDGYEAGKRSADYEAAALRERVAGLEGALAKAIGWIQKETYGAECKHAGRVMLVQSLREALGDQNLNIPTREGEA